MTAATMAEISPAERNRRDRFQGFMDVYHYARQADLEALEQATAL